ncbi:SMP-30/gluconolactonase/LRE family protein [Nocardia sp. NPDC050406]|uniref:SMP-30/gluconolactonase/LRE family protein n=1 Tax=Nocardia sp. NPDC050406 TaxID=3364318 RepID=UPI00378C631B
MSELSTAARSSGRRARYAAGIAVLALVTACGGAGGDGGGGLRGTTVPVAGGSPGTLTKPGAIEGFSVPESVVFAGDSWLVSNLGRVDPDPAAKDGDGFLTELNAVGTLTARRAMPRPGDPPLHAPKGMAAVDNRVFVADVDRIVGYDTSSHGQVFEAALGDGAPALLNDIVALDSRTLLVTDTYRDTVYQLDIETKHFEPRATGIPGANGIAIDDSGRTAYVVADGEAFEGGDLWRLDLTQTPAVPQRVGAVHGILDGVAVLSTGNIVVSDWISTQGDKSGTLTVYRPDGTPATQLRLPDNLHGPADFAVDPAGRNIWIPAMPDNRLVIVPLP